MSDSVAISRETAKRQTAAQPKADNGKAKRPQEPKDVRFRRLAQSRLAVALKRIKHVGNLANRASYSYTDQQVAKVMALLDGEVAAVRTRFTGAKDAPTSIDIG